MTLFLDFFFLISDDPFFRIHFQFLLSRTILEFFFENHVFCNVFV